MFILDFIYLLSHRQFIGLMFSNSRITKTSKINTSLTQWNNPIYRTTQNINRNMKIDIKDLPPSLVILTFLSEETIYCVDYRIFFLRLDRLNSRNLKVHR